LSKRLTGLVRLEGEQAQASSPKHHAALSASAGTGKTHVLTARVLRLLLSGVDPSSILCLTFTKAGAAEMADRIHARLAYWVRLKDADLRKELFALGEETGPDELASARRLFARVLDAAGGGLRIMTIHAFAQGLLAAFPAEAGLVPGFRPLEGREEQILARSTLAELLVRAEGQGKWGIARRHAGAQPPAGRRRGGKLPDVLRRGGCRHGRAAAARGHGSGCSGRAFGFRRATSTRRSGAGPNAATASSTLTR
jgi:ATP-dependent helicase/nuclease subunit A